MNNDYKIGQILFLILKDSMKVIPVKVVEEVKRRTEQGETITYSIKSPHGKMYDFVNDENNDVVFDSIKNIKSLLMQNAETSIDKVINTALKCAVDKFEYQYNDLNEKNELNKAVVKDINYAQTGVKSK
jgi:hypothetical protein